MRLELKDVRLAYQAGTPLATQALAGLSLTVEPGERVAVAGPVGSGKSTLLAVMSGLAAPDSGEVLHDGVPVTLKRPPAPGSVALAFQSPEDCLFARSVLDDVSFGPRSAGLSEAAVREKSLQALAFMGLDPEEFAGRNPFSLSAGEQRRAALAGVIAVAPRLLLLDEPAAYLDPASRADLVSRLIGLNEASRATIVLVTHDVEEIWGFAQRLVIVDDGQVAADADAALLLGDEELLDAHGLRPPELSRLSLLLEGAGDRGGPLHNEREAAARLLALGRADRSGESCA